MTSEIAVPGFWPAFYLGLLVVCWFIASRGEVRQTAWVAWRVAVVQFVMFNALHWLHWHWATNLLVDFFLLAVVVAHIRYRASVLLSVFAIPLIVRIGWHTAKPIFSTGELLYTEYLNGLHALGVSIVLVFALRDLINTPARGGNRNV